MNSTARTIRVSPTRHGNGRRRDGGPATRSAGFTMVEMMIALTISLLIVGALLTVVAGSSSAGATRDRASEMQTNGRFALEQIKTDLLHAGFLGISSLFFPDRALNAETPPNTIANDCSPSTTGLLSQRIWGAEDSNPYSATCIPSSSYLRGDVVVIRGLDPSVVTTPSAGYVYYHSAYEGGQPFAGATAPNFNATNKQPPYFDYRLNETVYYISKYTTSSTESPAVPALYRLRLGTGPAMAAELVASGVENLQARYGVLQTNNTMRYLAADQIAAADWDLVKAVQISLLVRASTSEAGYVNSLTYSMGGDDYAVNDGYRRMLLTTVVQFRN